MRKYYIFESIYDDYFAQLSSSPDEMNKVDWKIPLGLSVKNEFPSNIKLEFNEMHPGISVPDLVDNTLHFHIVSEKLKNILSDEVVQEIEFLPINIINHKKREEPGMYYIANLIGSVDCVDMENSSYRESNLKPEYFSRIKVLYIDETKVPEDCKLFRLSKMPWVFIIREDLVDVLKNKGIKGFKQIQMGERYTLT